MNSQASEMINDSHEPSSMCSLQRSKPRFLKTPDRIFKKMLSKVSADNLNMAQCLNTKEKLQLVRQLTEATSHFYYVELQQQLWQEYFNIGMKENVWGRKMSKSQAKQHATCRSFDFPKHIVEQRQATLTKQLQKATSERTKYAIELQNASEHWQPPIHADLLLESINTLVKNAQQRLRQAFDFRKAMLVMNSNDHRLITEFYNLQPTDDQVSTAYLIECL